MSVHLTTSHIYPQTPEIHGDALSDCPELFLKILGPERIRSIRTPNENVDKSYEGYAYRDDLEKYKELRVNSSSFVFSCKGEGILQISKKNPAGDLNFSYSCGYDNYPKQTATGYYVTMKNNSALEELLRKLFAKQSVEILMTDNQVFLQGIVTLQLV
jgi:hypothetical protein